MDAHITSAEKEFSKVWMDVNPEIFTNHILDFLHLHPTSDWSLSINQTLGFLKIKATRLNMQIIATYAKTGQLCYWDGLGFSLLRSSAKTMDCAAAIECRSMICNKFPACWIEAK